MINEEIANKLISVEMQLARGTYREIVRKIEQLLQNSKKSGGLDKFFKSQGNEIKLKDMVKKGQLEEIPVQEPELKELKKELNRHGVKFSVMKNKETEGYNVFFQAKDVKAMDIAFKNTLYNLEKKTERKESIRKNIEKFKDMANKDISKDKIRNKQKEQSL